MKKDYVNKQHKYGDRSVPFKSKSKIVSKDKPCYLSWVDSHFYAVIFNNSVPNNRWYKDGIETTSFIERGDSIPEGFKTYREGCEHSYAYMIKDMESV